jgi:hypothetical protein
VNEKFIYRLDQQMKNYRREDPATSPQLAVPVSITESMLRFARSKAHRGRRNALLEAIADLICIAFYYLLRVGEYTNTHGSKPKKDLRTQTKPFRVRDITFRNSNGKCIPNNASLDRLLAASEATMRIPNQKSGVKGQCIHNECTETEFSPVKCLARRVHHIMSNGGTPDHEIFLYKGTGKKFSYVAPRQINEQLKKQAKVIGLYQLGYGEKDISSHSLRAGGAMAMHLNKIDVLTIQKMGRWKSDTFMCYIHDQISTFAAGLSKKMSNDIPFRHIAGPELDGDFVPAPAA